MKDIRTYTLFLTLVGLMLSLSTWAQDEEEKSSTTFSRITVAKGMSDNHVQHLQQLDDGRMLVVTTRNINLYDGGGFVTFPRNDAHLKPVPHHQDSYFVTVDHQQRVWIKEWGVMWGLDLRSGSLITNYDSLFTEVCGPKGPKAAAVTDFFADSEGNLWLLTATGLWDVAGRRMLPLPQNGTDVAAVDVDKSTLYLFDTTGGVTLCHRRDGHPFAHCPYPVAEGEPQHFATWGFVYVLPDKDGSFYRLIKGRPSFIDRFDPATQTWHPLFSSNMVLFGFTQTANGCLVVTNRHGLVFLQLSATPSPDCTLLSTLIPSPPPSGVESQVPITFYPTFELDDGTFLQTTPINSVLFTPDGGWWIGMGENGILYTHPLRHRIKTAAEHFRLGIPDSIVGVLRTQRSLLYDGMRQKASDQLTDHTIGAEWKARHNGLLVCVGGDSVLLTSADGLAGDYCISLVEDKKGRIWAALTRGISCIERTPLPLHDPHAFHITSYGLDDGCPPWTILNASAYLLAGGDVVMGCEQGWIRFTPDSITRPQLTLSPKMTGLYVNERRIHGGLNDDGITLHAEPPFAHDITLNYQQNNIVLEFSTFTYSFPNETHYRWRIARSGGDDEWHYRPPSGTESPTLRLSFMHMQPGTYHVEVQASSDGLHYDGATAIFTLRITPPWWQTWWAYTLFILGIIAVATTTIAFYMRSQRRHRRRLEAANRQLQTAYDNIAQLNKVKTTFIQNMTHELRTPLHQILGFAQVVSMMTEDNQELHECTDAMQTQGQNLLSLVDDAILLSDIESQPLHPEDVPLSEVLQKAIRTTIHGKSDSVALHYDDHEWEHTLTTDAHLLTTVLSNLLSNAFKFTSTGSVRLQCRQTEQGTHISVADTGPGIPADKAEAVFERFFKLDEFIPGAGLGLSVCQEIIARLGGTITVDTTYHEGCKMDVRLP